jgi:hypothetical protein
MAEYELKQELGELEDSLASVEAVLKPSEIKLEIRSPAGSPD